MYRTWAEISLKRIAANFEALRRAAGGAEVAPVVKANAYGHGAVAVARRLEAEGAKWLGVSNAVEGATLRQAGIEARILVMGGFIRDEIDAFFDHGLTPVVHSLDSLKELERVAGARGEKLKIHIKLDTGMGRLGTQAPASEIAGALRALQQLECEGVMSHLASAADFDSEQTLGQAAAFDAALDQLRAGGVGARLVHMATSAPLAYGMKKLFHSMVRPGLAVYGYVPEAVGPAPEVRVRVEPALEWKARVLEVKAVAAGAPVGYNAQWRAGRGSRIAVVAAGYADGVPHTLAGRGRVIAGEQLVPVVGAVSMDLITVDVTESPAVRAGDVVTILGAEAGAVHSAADLAREGGVIPYVVLCGIGNRVVRVYVD